jgi:16S rRNA processing protein RimM
VTDAARAADDRLVVALVRGVHGMHGVVRVEILTDRPEDRYAPGSVLYPEGSDRRLSVTWSSAVADGPGWRIQFAEIPDRSAAETLVGRYLEIAAGPEAPLPRGAYYWHEVIGTPVTSTTGEALGTVQDVYRSGGAEVYIVAGGPYGEFDVPGVRDFVRIFAPRRGEIVIDTAALDLGPLPDASTSGERPRAPRRRQGSRRGRPAGAASAGPATAGQAATDSPRRDSSPDETPSGEGERTDSPSGDAPPDGAARRRSRRNPSPTRESSPDEAAP